MIVDGVDGVITVGDALNENINLGRAGIVVVMESIEVLKEKIKETQFRSLSKLEKL